MIYSLKFMIVVSLIGCFDSRYSIGLPILLGSRQEHVINSVPPFLYFVVRPEEISNATELGEYFLSFSRRVGAVVSSDAS